MPQGEDINNVSQSTALFELWDVHVLLCKEEIIVVNNASQSIFIKYMTTPHICSTEQCSGPLNCLLSFTTDDIHNKL